MKLYESFFYTVILALSGILGLSAADAPTPQRVEYKGDFAPTDSFVKAPEKEFRDAICLNGLWQFQPIAVPPKYKEGADPTPALTPPDAAAWEKTPIRIPSPWNVNSFADRKGMGGDFRTYPSYPTAWEEVKMGWLKRSFTVPASWKGRRIQLHFEAAAGEIQVQVNGKEIGKHFDIFFPFTMDVTDAVQFGSTNELLVGVRKPSLFDVRGKYGKRTYQAGSFWGQHVVGLWQDVNLVAVPVARVTDVFVQPLVSQGELKAQVTLQNDGTVPLQIQVEGSVLPWIYLPGKDLGQIKDGGIPEGNWKLADKSALQFSPAAISVPAGGQQTVTLTQKIGAEQLKLWSPDSPSLYGLLIDVKSGTSAIDRKYTRFGWREVKISGKDVLLNGKPYIFRGDSWHFLGVPQLTRRYAWAWYKAMKDANLNTVRLHAQPYPSFYLDVADEMGVLVLDETAIWASDGNPKLDDDAYWKDTEQHVEALVRRDRNHPSVFGWSVCNEVKPIVQNVFHNPPGMWDKLVGYYARWAEICVKLDPTRNWISADGDEDGGGKLPFFMVHYGGTGTMEKGSKSGKPWGVGEASGAYYATPEQTAKTYGERAYVSFQGRIEGIAAETYKNLLEQKRYNGNFRSVFNLAWYSLQPLPFGKRDLTTVPSLVEGIHFTTFTEGKPGIQPERLGPYCTTLNPGFDPELPLYKTWPLFDAIKAAQSEPVADYTPPPAPASAAEPAKPKPVKSIAILYSKDGKLQSELASLGVAFEELRPSGTAPELLFIDGASPPSTESRNTIDGVLSAGGSVVVWRLTKDALPGLNALISDKSDATGSEYIALTDRTSSSLVTTSDSETITAGLKPSDLYFSESTPQIILENGVGGKILSQGNVLLEACNADWIKWNKEAEFAKTGMIFRSEHEAKPSGAVLVCVTRSKGKLYICNLPAASKLYKVQLMSRKLLENWGIPLKPQVDLGGAFLKTGVMTRVLACGRFPTADGGDTKMFADPSKGGGMKDNERVDALRWRTLAADDSNSFDLRKAPLSGPNDDAVIYLSFWVLSPRSLDNLLLEPNVPKVDLKYKSQAVKSEGWLNGKSIAVQQQADGTALLSGLPLQQGWNHLLVRLVHGKGEISFQSSLVCSQPEFLNELKSATQKP